MKEKPKKIMRKIVNPQPLIPFRRNRHDGRKLSAKRCPFRSESGSKRELLELVGLGREGLRLAAGRGGGGGQLLQLARHLVYKVQRPGQLPAGAAAQPAVALRPLHPHHVTRGGGLLHTSIISIITIAAVTLTIQTVLSTVSSEVSVGAVEGGALPLLLRAQVQHFQRVNGRQPAVPFGPRCRDRGGQLGGNGDN